MVGVGVQPGFGGGVGVGVQPGMGGGFGGGGAYPGGGLGAGVGVGGFGGGVLLRKRRQVGWGSTDVQQPGLGQGIGGGGNTGGWGGSNWGPSGSSGVHKREVVGDVGGGSSSQLMGGQQTPGSVSGMSGHSSNDQQGNWSPSSGLSGGQAHHGGLVGSDSLGGQQLAGPQVLVISDNFIRNDKDFLTNHCNTVY